MSENFKRNKKKKRSLNQMLKKNSNFGNDNELPEEKYFYYTRIFQQLSHLENDEKGSLINNFFRELVREDDIKKVVGNRMVSRILDETLAFAQTPVLLEIIDLFSDNLRFFCTHQFASHVLQTILAISVRYSQDLVCRKDLGGQEDDELVIKIEDKDKLRSFVLKVSKFVYNNLSEFVSDTYGSHVVRTVLEACSGVAVSAEVKKGTQTHIEHSIRDHPTQVVEPTPEMISLVNDFAVRLSRLPDFSGIIQNNCVSAVLQTAVSVLHSVDKDACHTLIRRVIDQGFATIVTDGQDFEVHPLFENHATSRLMEVILSHASEKQLEELFEKYFRSQIPSLVLNPVGNFAVKRLLNVWSQKESFAELYTIVSECLEDALDAGHGEVVVSWIRACRRLGVQQLNAIKKMMVILGCDSPESKQALFVPLLLHFIRLEEYDHMKAEGQRLPKISIHGSLIIQEILLFHRPIKCVQSMLEMSAPDLVRVGCDPRGSHIFDAFSTSPGVSQANRAKIFTILKGHLINLALDKHGSRTLESLWSGVGVATRTAVCQELFECKERLSDSKFGRIIYNAFKVKFFHANERKDWEELQQSEIKKKQVLQNLLKETEIAVEENKDKSSDSSSTKRTIEETEISSNEMKPESKKKKKEK